MIQCSSLSRKSVDVMSDLTAAHDPKFQDRIDGSSNFQRWTKVGSGPRIQPTRNEECALCTRLRTYRKEAASWQESMEELCRVVLNEVEMLTSPSALQVPIAGPKSASWSTTASRGEEPNRMVIFPVADCWLRCFESAITWNYADTRGLQLNVHRGNSTPISRTFYKLKRNPCHPVPGQLSISVTF